jgi:uncharacterized protein YbjT (DUF2867 family)
MHPQDEKGHLKTRNSSIVYYSDLPIEEQMMTAHSSSDDNNNNNNNKAIMRSSRISLPWILSAIATVLLLSVPLLVLDCDYCFSSSKQQLVATVTSTTSDDSTAAAAAAAASGIISKTGGEIVVVTGATGRLGSKLYFELQRNEQVSEVRAIVRTREKARSILGCNRCDETEGIYIGDITNPNGIDCAMEDGKVTSLAIASGVSPYGNEDEQRAVEFDGVVNSVRSLVMNSNNNKSLLKVVLCSSMGTTEVLPPSAFGNILHWKLNAEAFLSTAGIPSFIVKPCGLKDDLPTNYALFTGNFDTPSKYHAITRDNVAHVMAEAVIMNDSDEQKQQQQHQHYRFDLCSKPGTPTTDFKKLIEDSVWE